MTRRMLLAGYFGFGNLGDEAILAGLAAGLEHRFPGVQLVVTSGDPDRTQREHSGIQATPWNDIERLIDAARRSSLIILGGGGLFHDYWPADTDKLLTIDQAGLSFYASIPVLAHLLGKPCAVLGVGVGPLESQAARDLAAASLSCASEIMVRDADSQKLLEELGLTAVKLGGDLALLIEPAPDAQVEAFLRQAGVPAGSELMALNLRYWDFGVDPAELPVVVARTLDEILEETGLHCVFIPFQRERVTPHEDDWTVLQSARRAMARKSQVTLFDQVPSPKIVRGIYRRCRFALGMRLHSAIFSTAAGVPTLALAYDPKVRSWMSSVGMEDAVLNPDDWTVSGITRAWRSAAGTPPDARSVQEIHERVIQALDRLPALASGTTAPLSLQDEFLRSFSIDKVRRLAELQSRLETTERHRAALEQHLSIAQQEGDRLRGEVASAQAQAHHASEQLEQLSQEHRALQEEMEQLSREHRALQEQMEQLSREHRALQEQMEQLSRKYRAKVEQLDDAWAELRSSRAWQLIQWLWTLRLRIAPPQSRRERLLLGALDRLRRERRPRAAPVPAGTPAELEVALLYPDWWETAADRDLHLLRLELFAERHLAHPDARAVVIFSAVPLLLSEGQRGMWLAQAFSSMDVPVIFAAWRWFPDPIRSDFDQDPRILQIPMDVLVTQGEALFLRSASKPLKGCVLFEFPHPSLFRIVSLAKAYGWSTLYDVIDDWEAFHQVGQAVWYDPVFESYLLRNVDHVIATNPFLAEKAKRLGACEAHLVRNAYPGPSFAPSSERVHLPKGHLTIGYFGHLTPSWFDWETVERLARKHPEWVFHIIGYGGGPSSHQPNLLMLGKVAHERLPEYAANWDVAMIPFRPGPLTLSVDPVKVYEYLALSLPVVTQGMPHLADLPGVWNADSPQHLERLLEEVPALPLDHHAIREFLENNTWQKRAELILWLAEQPSQDPFWPASQGASEDA